MGDYCCARANGLEFEEVKIEIGKGQHRTPEYAGLILFLSLEKILLIFRRFDYFLSQLISQLLFLIIILFLFFTEVNPMKQVPAIVHGDFKLHER